MSDQTTHEHDCQRQGCGSFSYGPRFIIRSVLTGEPCPGCGLPLYEDEVGGTCDECRAAAKA